MHLDGGAGLLLDTADDLATGADDVADLVNRNLDRDDARRVLGQLLARGGNLLEHGVEDEGAAALGLAERLGEDLGGQALGLVVHLQGGDALGRAADLEVHVAEEVLEALDVGQNDVLVTFLDEAHGHAGNGALDGHAGVHERERRAAGRRHGRRAVGLHDLGDDADGVRELLLVGDHRLERARRQGAVAELAALGGAHAADLAGAVRREVVLVDVALALDRIDRVEALPLVEHAERDDREDLRLAALEQAGAVGARQVVRLDVERADLVVGATVDALAGLDDHRAHGALLERLARRGDLATPHGALLVGEGGLDLVLELLDLGDAGLLVGVLEGGFHGRVVSVDLVDDLGNGLVELVGLGLDRALVEELLLLVAERADRLLRELERGDHVGLADLVRARFDHGDVLLGAGDGEVEVGSLGLLEGRVDDVVDAAVLGLGAGDAHAGDRALDGHAAHHEGRRGAHDGDDVRLVHLVAGQRGDDDVDVVAHAVGKARANGTIDETGSERALLAGSRLAFEVTAGNAADGVHLLDEIHRKGEEI